MLGGAAFSTDTQIAECRCGFKNTSKLEIRRCAVFSEVIWSFRALALVGHTYCELRSRISVLPEL